MRGSTEDHCDSSSNQGQVPTGKFARAQLSIAQNYDKDEWIVLYSEAWYFLLGMEDDLILK
jgi:hypothetical protein